jgi:hypothetical protein
MIGERKGSAVGVSVCHCEEFKMRTIFILIFILPFSLVFTACGIKEQRISIPQKPKEEAAGKSENSLVEDSYCSEIRPIYIDKLSYVRFFIDNLIGYDDETLSEAERRSRHCEDLRNVLTEIEGLCRQYGEDDSREFRCRVEGEQPHSRLFRKSDVKARCDERKSDYMNAIEEKCTVDSVDE